MLINNQDFGLAPASLFLGLFCILRAIYPFSPVILEKLLEANLPTKPGFHTAFEVFCLRWLYKAIMQYSAGLVGSILSKFFGPFFRFFKGRLLF